MNDKSFSLTLSSILQTILLSVLHDCVNVFMNDKSLFITLQAVLQIILFSI